MIGVRARVPTVMLNLPILELQLFTLLKVVWFEDKAFLQLVGFDIRLSSYMKAFALLYSHYEKKKIVLQNTGILKGS